VVVIQIGCVEMVVMGRVVSVVVRPVEVLLVAISIVNT
jgi:hypothetical protein